MGPVRIDWTYLNPGEKSQGTPIVPKVLAEFPEMLWQAPPDQASDRLIQATERIERIEFTATDPDGNLIGFAVLTEDEDPHIGTLAGVQWFFVVPERRGRVGLRMRRAMEMVAIECGFELLAYTHRLGLGRYEINYIRLTPRRNDGQEDSEGGRQGFLRERPRQA